MRPRSAAVLFAVAGLAGCSLKDLAKADDAGAAQAAADAGAAATPITSATVAAAASSATPTVAGKAANSAAGPKIGYQGAKIPTCGKGQLMGSEAMSPFKPFCGAPCKADAECKGGACVSVNALTPDGTNVTTGPQFIKICEQGLTPAPSAAATTTAAPTSTPAGPGKCTPKEHWDDINKKCRPLGDCPKGYRWNDPMQSCVMDG
jgi:hypothetical protein